ncbi:MAG: selenocysteine-specific translation elongation factor, partial [Gemmatimonadetes bacterium]|nr:selenocysteine-specific translation elongation factor [Gemmatimonadota bacterium]
MERRVIIGTAGHIDHGKSALVEALTGRAMDPLAEERRRGITLDLHFAPYRLPDGSMLGVVDVPGHEDLIRSMSAGAAGMDLVLLVVAADEGIMPQTREHLAVLEQLGVPAGIPVLTKADLAEPAWLELVREEVAGWLAGSSVRFTAPLAVSARSGAGLDALREAIAGAVRAGGGRGAPADLARLPIDRAFTLAGAGTVVTGSSWSGSFSIGDQVRILPAGITARIRSLEEHGTPVEASRPGQRLAVGLAGVEVSAVRRGETLVHDAAAWEAATVLDAR